MEKLDSLPTQPNSIENTASLKVLLCGFGSTDFQNSHTFWTKSPGNTYQMVKNVPVNKIYSSIGLCKAKLNIIKVFNCRKSIENTKVINSSKNVIETFNAN